MNTQHTPQDPRLPGRSEDALRADLEQVWQDESPATAAETEFADQVDGRLGTRHRTERAEEGES
ncbi:hypothetical protein [Pseudoclavibacter soli]|uniref:hypothetical protein n=1 Tax=Pseudoclavibacter soli TaxID=452623 RepID=UPI00040E6757|nr:hypothetical protein [Pseudoclavibacter soli]